jgi:SAM-dependent methyltransferase
MLYQDRVRATSFGANPELYHRTRPSYPDQLVSRLLVDGAGDVLDVGCGTGITAILFASRGCRVLGVEVDERMASYARQLGIDVETARFEDWDPRGRAFDLLVSGQAWHWVDPDLGAHQAAEALRVDGRIGLFWNRARHPAEVQTAFEAVYRRLAPGLDEHSIVLGHGTSVRFEQAAAGLAASGRFGPVDQVGYRWTTSYTTAQWLDQLVTHSDHQALAPEVRDRILDAIAAVIDAWGGSFFTEYETVLVTASRASGRR